MKAAVLGYGTVGSGVVEVLVKNHDVILAKAGVDIEVKYILDLREFPGDPFEDKVIHDVNVILEDPEIDIVCETMGGNEPAFTFSKKALMAGKSVCTSNKELVANHGPELLALAKENQVSYMFEASVGGGIPIIRPINECLMQEDIQMISGILNGTTNYILTKMTREGSDFQVCLKEAQEKGYAERNPEADVEGYDACRKLAILASLMTGKTVHFEDIRTEGITAITPEDIAFASAWGRSIKLFACARMEQGTCYASVTPAMVSRENPLYAVNDVFNAVCVRGNMLGDSMFYGKGAGKLPTASAVVSDVVECAVNKGKNVKSLWGEGEMKLGSMDDFVRQFFVRAKAGCEAQVKELFGEVEMIPSCVEGQIGFVCGPVSEKEFALKSAALGGFLSGIRVEE